MASISNAGYVCFRIGVWNLLSVAHPLRSVTGQLLYIKVLTAHDLGGLPSVVFQFRSIPLGRNVEITFVWLSGLYNGIPVANLGFNPRQTLVFLIPT